ncbi:MAG: hypothetical protein D6681_20115 [Calditrichaeota bacterium]|nr:MAG: hypothetical protein D6681_20115 [Calditrichota bacterium]
MAILDKLSPFALGIGMVVLVLITLILGLIFWRKGFRVKKATFKAPGVSVELKPDSEVPLSSPKNEGIRQEISAEGGEISGVDQQAEGNNIAQKVQSKKGRIRNVRQQGKTGSTT